MIHKMINDHDFITTIFESFNDEFVQEFYKIYKKV